MFISCLKETFNEELTVKIATNSDNLRLESKTVPFALIITHTRGVALQPCYTA